MMEKSLPNLLEFSLIPNADYCTSMELTRMWSLGIEVVHSIEKNRHFANWLSAIRILLACYPDSEYLPLRLHVDAGSEMHVLKFSDLLEKMLHFALYISSNKSQ